LGHFPLAPYSIVLSNTYILGSYRQYFVDQQKKGVGQNAPSRELIQKKLLIKS